MVEAHSTPRALCPLRAWWYSSQEPPLDVLSTCPVDLLGHGLKQPPLRVDLIFCDTEISLASDAVPPAIVVALGEVLCSAAMARLPMPATGATWHQPLHLLQQLRAAQLAGESLRQEAGLAEGRLAVAEGQLSDLQERMLELEHQASLAQLVRSLAHELNNPLAVILGNAELIARGGADQQRLLRRAGTIVEQVDHCKDIIMRLRKFARPQGESAEGLAIAQVIAQAVQRLQRRGHAVPNVQVEEAFPLLHCGRQALVRSVEQVLDNAIRAGASQISVHGNGDAHRCAVAFANDGVAPSDEALRQACRPFYSDRGGAGLGMSLAASLLAEYQGQIALQRPQAGQGAVAVITLPVSTQRADPARTPSNTRLQTAQVVRQQHLLVVEDDDLLAELIVLTAEELGWGVQVARSVDEFAKARDALHADAVVADVHIVGGDGLTLLGEMLTRQPRMGAVIMSGDIQQAKVQAFVQQHHCYALGKPFRIQDLRAVLIEFAQASLPPST